MWKKSAKQKLKIKQCFPILIMLMVGLLFLIEGIQDCILLINPNNKGIFEYHGTFKICEKNIFRNTSYEFVLDNGDTIYIPSEYLLQNEINIAEFEELKFKYSSHKDIFGRFLHLGVSITSVDENVVFVEDNYVKEDSIFGIITYLIIGFLTVIVSIIPFLNFNVVLWLFRCFCGKRQRKDKV